MTAVIDCRRSFSLADVKTTKPSHLAPPDFDDLRIWTRSRPCYACKQRRHCGGQMPPVALCTSGVCKEPRNPGKCGSAPNKYCYRRDCYAKGVERGHIRPAVGKRPAVASSSAAPFPDGMERDGDGERERPSFGVAKLYEIHAIYGWRLRAASLPRLCAALSHVRSAAPCLSGPSTPPR